MPELFASPPLFSIGYTAFKSLIRVLSHNSLQAFQEGKGIRQRPRKPTIDPLMQLPNFFPVRLNPNIAIRNLPIPYDYGLVISLYCQDGGMMPFTGFAEETFDATTKKHLDFKYLALK